MRTVSHKEGQSLVEILFAIAVFTLSVVTVGFLVLDSQVSLRGNIEASKASLLAYEGIEAVRSIGSSDYGEVAVGTYGISLENGVWQLSPASDSVDSFTRSITIDDVDGEIKRITSTVVWQLTAAREGVVSLTDYLSNWRDTDGDARFLDVDMSAAALAASSTELGGIDIENVGSLDITITGITAQWENVHTLDRVTIDSVDVFSASSSSGATSGDFIDISDYVLTPSSGVVSIVFAFSGVMTGSNFIISFSMSDESKKHALIDL